jgi:hypothetical protein
MQQWSGVKGQPQDMEHNHGQEGGNGGGDQAAAAGHKCACPPPPPRVRGPAIPPLLGPTGVQRLSVNGRAYNSQWLATAVDVAFPPSRQCPAIPPLLGLMGVKDCQLTTRARQLAPKGINPRVVEITICSCHQTMIPTTGLQGFRGRFIALPCP